MPSALNHRLQGSFPGSSLPLLLSPPLAKHLPPWKGHSASPFCLLSAHVLLLTTFGRANPFIHVFTSPPIWWASLLLSVIVCAQHGSQSTALARQKQCNITTTTHGHCYSLSPDGWCRALLIFHYHFLNLVTSRVSDFHWSPAVLNPEGWGFSPSLFIAGAIHQFTLGLKVSHCPDSFKSLFKPFPSFYFLQLQMCSFSPSLLPSLPPPTPASLRGFPLSSLQSQ